MTTSRSQGDIGIERLCQRVGISRSGYYRHWQRSSPRQEETGLRDAIQRLALKHRHYGYRRIGALLRREGWQANHKRVLRLLREDNLLRLRQSPFVPMTTNSRHTWCVVPNLTRGIVLNGLDQLWVADITYLHLAEEFGYLAVILDAFSRKVVGWALDAASASGTRDFGAGHGHHSTATEARRSDPSFRSWGAIRLHRVHGNPGGARYPAQHEPVSAILTTMPRPKAS
jgi:transposase InsO family protein